MKNFIITIFVMAGLLLGFGFVNAITIDPQNPVYDVDELWLMTCEEMEEPQNGFCYYDDDFNEVDCGGCEEMCYVGEPEYCSSWWWEVEGQQEMIFIEFVEVGGEEYMDYCNTHTFEECVASTSGVVDYTIATIIYEQAGFGMEIGSVSIANILGYSNNLFGSIWPLLALIVGFPLAFWLINRVMDLVKVRIRKDE